MTDKIAEQQEGTLDGLEERLQNHAKAFESLLALTAARDHYGSQIDDGLDPSEQWNRKKQTKEQKRAAKKAKLDPANQKSVMDVMKEREKKRKRELGMEEDGDDIEPEENEQLRSNKKQRKEMSGEDKEAKAKEIADKRRQKREAKKEKNAKLKAKAEAKKAAKQDTGLMNLTAEETQADAEVEAGADGSDNNDEDDLPVARGEQSADMATLDVSGLAPSDNEQSSGEAQDGTADNESSVPTSPAVNSPAFDVATNHSDVSSSSSIIPPTASEKTSKPLPSFTEEPSGTLSPKIVLPDIDTEELQARLRKRIDELRARRKADGPDGKPARSRQELLEQRRAKEEQRKAHKKELRRKAKEEEARKRDEQLRGSCSPLSSDIFSRNSPRPQENSFSFSRLAFDDGTAADASMTELRDAKKRKGPQDPRTALQAAENKQSRLAGLDAEKRADIADKDMWLNAKKRAHGERVRDDTSLLKKALKRKEKQKGKSEKEWKEREQAVIKGKEVKQKKREANLQKRREEKGNKGNKKKPSGGKGKKKGRPGFEGRFKA